MNRKKKTERFLSDPGLSSVVNKIEKRPAHQSLDAVDRPGVKALYDGLRTMMVGQNEEVRAFVTCVNILSSSTSRKSVITVMEVDFAGRKAGLVS